MGLFLGVPQTSARLNVSPLVILGWIKNLGYDDPLFRDIISTLMEGVTANGVDRVAHEFRLSQDTLRRIIAFAKREVQEADKKIEEPEKLDEGMDVE